MSERILVRGELSVWVHVGRVAGFVALVVGVGIGLAGPPWGWIVAAGGAALWICLEVVAFHARWVRTRLTIQTEGFLVEDRRGSRAIHDAEVIAVALESKRNFSQGQASSVTRTFRLWTERDTEPVVMYGTIKSGQSDPIADLIDRLHDALLARMEQDLARGLAVGGDGWQMNSAVLSIGRPPNDQQFPLSEITAIDQFDGKLCLWRRGMDEAAAKLAPNGRNVYLLPALLAARMAPQSEKAANDSATGLGRVLFQRKPHTGVVFGLLLGGLVLCIGGLLALVTHPKWPDGMIWFLCLFTVGVILFPVGVWTAFQAFRVHERGVWQGGLFGQKLLRYADVGTFRYQAVDHYHNGVYVGTYLTMDFRPISPELGKRIRYNASVRGGDDDLDTLRDHVSRAIAANMAELYNAGQPVFWTGNLQFLKDGIQYRPSGFLGRKDALILPYEQYGGYDIQQGVFYLFAKGNAKAVCTEQTSTENFFPGFFLLLLLLHTPVDEQEAEAGT
ncbi:MAG TPA: hypothetical protein VFV87_23210 [Pirellulaceae bacterium]|nr:hypothetical protein [Pirellulaceae bacterium]